MIFERFPDLYNSPGANRFREEKRRCTMEADAVICVSEATKQQVQRFYNLDSAPIYVVPHACSNAFKQTENFDDIPVMPIDEPFLLYIGRRSHYKNFDLLIQAYRVWSKKNDAALVLVGGRQWSDDEQKRLAELGIQGRVHILENVTDQILCYLYNKAVGFVYPSLYEGFGIPLLEAMACGCPIVASHIPSTIEVAGQCPVYFKPTDADDLLNALDITLSEGRNSKRVQAGLERVKTYSWDKTAAETLKVYRAVCT
jgi:glycosyltransferase involved in cell wall biosynthesis